MSRVTSQAGIDLIKSFEGFTSTAFRLQVGTDSNGNAIYDSQNYTYGYGHCGPEVKPGQTITKAEAEELLRKDIKQFEDDVNNTEFVSVTNSLNQNQFDALVSFRYNCGGGGLKYLCQGKTVAQIGEALPSTYITSNHVVLQGLINRRKKEQALYNTPVSSAAESTSSASTAVSYDKELTLALQHAWNAAFNGALVEDGVFGVKTEAFVKAHNVYKGIKAKWAVCWVQTCVGAKVDGVFGSETYGKVCAYQKANDLTVDGIVGVNTVKIILTV